MNQGDPGSQTNTAWTAAAALTWLKGGHTVKTGGELRAYQWDSVQGDGVFRLGFDRGFTRRDPNAADASGYGLASFMLGVPAGGTLYRYPFPDYLTRHVGLFLQDDWKVSPRLTVNLGVRWEYEGPTTDGGDAISNFDPSVMTVVDGLTLQGGLTYPGVGAQPRGNRDVSWTDVSPRAGLAYQWRPDTVVRAAYGLYYLPTTGIFVRLGTTGFSTQSALVASTDGGLTPAGDLSNPFPQGAVTPSGSALGALTGLGTNISGNPRSYGRGRSHQWNLDVQRQLSARWSLALGYIGNRGLNLPANRQYHYLPESALGQGAALQQLVDNPFAGLITEGPLAQPRVPRATLLTSYPQFLGVTGLDNWAESWYHAGTVRLERRYSDGLSLLLSYTWSKALDTNTGNGSNTFTDGGSDAVQNWDNLAAEKAVSSNDQPHRLVVSGTYALPFARTTGGVVGAIARGWQVNAIASFVSGNVIAVTANPPAFGGSRPNLTGEDPSVDDPTEDAWLNRAAFANLAAFSYGNGPRNLPRTRTQSLVNLDVSVFKNIGLGATRSLQLRAEFFNVTNRTTLGSPNANINSAVFGTITTLRTNTAPRRIQVGVKAYF